MGDGRRFRVFAEFITQQFPDARKVADIGGGRGLLSVELQRVGFESVVIDPRRVENLPRRIRKEIRKEALRSGKLTNIAKAEIQIEQMDLSSFDLAVGMHPDQATEHIVRESVQAAVPFAIVPCCVMPIDGLGRTFEVWLEYLASLAQGSRTARLQISGRNTVLYWRPDFRDDPRADVCP